MKHSEMLNLNLPEDNDLINVGHLSGNFEKIDSAFQTLPIKQEESKTDIDVMACPPYWTMHNATDEDIVYIDHNFFDEEFTLEAGQTITNEIEEPVNIRISSEVTIDYTWFIPASEAFSGGGGGGTSDYNKLNNLPTINNVEIKNNKTADDLGLVAKENGKGLSTNDFSNAYKSQLDGLDDALDAKLNANSVGAAGGVAELGSDGKVPSSQLPDPVAQKEYRIAEEASTSYAKVYKLQQKNGETWSDISGSEKINIPKDMVVESGSVKECAEDNVPVSGYKKGDKYIDLVIANKADAHIYINVKDLIDNKAEGIQYSNTTSKLEATNVQSAIDEIAETLKDKVDETELSSAIDGVKTNILSTVVASSNASASNAKALDFQGTGKALEKLVIEGKTVQDGTPSPSSPVEVKGVGNKSRNLIDQNTVYSAYVQNDGTIRGTNAQLLAVHISLPDEYVGKKITASIKVKPESGVSRSLIQYRGTTNADGNSVNVNVTDWTTITVTYTQGGYFQLNYGSGTGNVTIYEVMIEEGSSRTAYEPYGKYKIPISVAGTTKNVYLDAPLFNGDKADLVSGVAEKKWGMMVLDGTQTGANMASGRNHAVYGLPISNMKAGSRANGYCDRFVPANSWDQEGTVAFGTSGNNLYITFPDSLGISTIEQAKTWFAANPTTVVYPLATDTKETFEAPEIATVTGKNTLNVGTEVTPTKVEVTSFGEYYSKAQIDKMLTPKRITDITSGIAKADANLFTKFNVSWANIVYTEHSVSIDIRISGTINTAIKSQSYAKIATLPLVSKDIPLPYGTIVGNCYHSGYSSKNLIVNVDNQGGLHVIATGNTLSDMLDDENLTLSISYIV